jgi:hypothetical protein
LIALAFAAHVSLATTFTIVDAGLARTQVDVQRIEGAKLFGRTPQGQVEMNTRDVVMLSRAAGNVISGDAQRFQLVLRNGESLAGRATAFSSDTVTWQTTTLGKRDVPLAQIDRVVRAGAEENVALTPEEATRDVLLLSNGDRAGGIITAMDEKTVTLQGADGQPLSVEWTSIRQIRLAAAGDAVPTRSKWRVSLSDGSVVDVDSIELRNEQSLIVKLGTRSTSVPVDTVRSIENLDGRARMLVRIPPMKQEYAPYFPRAGSENTLAIPEEVVVGDLRTRAFIAARPYSRITWAIEGKPDTFKTRFAVAGSGPLAQCQIRIWLDDRKVLDRADLTSDTALETFETRIGDARTVTLEVDFGENFDVQDQIYWIEPAFISE